MAGGAGLSFSAQVSNPAALPLNFALETASGPAATPTPSSSTWSLGDLNKAISAAWAAAGTSVIRVRDANNNLSNSLTVTVSAAPPPPPPPPPPAPTVATLGGTNTATTGVAHVETVTLNAAADQAYTVTWSRSNGGTGPATTVIPTGQTQALGNSTWGAAGAGRTVDFTISPNITRAGRPLSVTVSDAPPPPPAPPAQPAPASILNETGGTSIRVSAGKGFRRGDIPAGNIITSPDFTTLQGVVLNRWDDGSVRFAVICGAATKPNNATTAVSFTGSAGSLGSPVAESVLIGAAPNAVISFSGVGSVALADLLGVASTLSGGRMTAGRVRPLFQGPLCSSWLYFSPIAGHAHLAAWFEVRCWNDGVFEIKPWIENGWWNVTGPTAYTGTASFALGGSTVFSTSVTLHHHTRCALIGANAEPWRSSAAFATLLDDPAYLQDTELVPTYYAAANESVLSGLVSSYVPMAAASMDDPMGAGGYSPGIGLIPQWDVAYVTTADKRARKAVLINALSHGRWPTHYRDETTNRTPLYASYPTRVINSAGTASLASIASSTINDYTPIASGATPPIHASSHHPSVGYLAYLMTGWNYYIDEMQHTSTMLHFKNSDGTRGGASGIFLTSVGANTPRGAAWAWRTLAQTVALTPDDDPMLANFVGAVTGNINYFHGTYVAQPNNPFGFLAPYGDYTAAVSGTTLAGSTASVINLSSPAANIPEGVYNGWQLTIGGQTRPVTLYEASLQRATVSPAFTVSTVGVPYQIADNKVLNAIWMEDFGTAAIGYMRSLGLPISTETATKLAAFHDWKSRSVVGRFGEPGRAQDFHYCEAAQYTLAVAPTDTPDFVGGTGPWYANWGEVYTATTGLTNTATPGDQLRGDSAMAFPSATGYWANLLPALSYAVRHDCPGAAYAMTKMRDDPNWAAFLALLPGTPVWGVRPNPKATWPDWLLAGVAETWTEIPFETSLAALNPALDPGLNPNISNVSPAQNWPEYMSSYTSSWEYRLTAWNSPGYNRKTDTVEDPSNGGHGDYPGSDQIRWLLRRGKQVAQYLRVAKSAGWDGSVITNDQARIVSGAGDTLVLPVGTQAPAIYPPSTRDEASQTPGAYVGMSFFAFNQTGRTILTHTVGPGPTVQITVSPPFAVDLPGRLYGISNGPMVQGLNGEKSGHYANGDLRPSHTYNLVVVNTITGRTWIPVTGSGYSWTATQGDAYTVEFVDNVPVFSPGPGPALVAGSFGAAACFDPTRGAEGTIWYIGSNSGRLAKLDCATRAWSQSSLGPVRGGYQCIAFLPRHRWLLLGADGGQWAIYDPAADTWHALTVSGTAAGGDTQFGHASPEYVDRRRAVEWWNNAAGSTTIINRMVVPANPKTDAWAIAQIAVAGGNAVTPSAAAVNGTFKRFFRSDVMNGYGLKNHVNGPTYFRCESTGAPL